MEAMEMKIIVGMTLFMDTTTVQRKNLREKKEMSYWSFLTFCLSVIQNGVN